MNPLKIAFQKLFFVCWEHSQAKMNYVDILLALAHLGEQQYPELMEKVRKEPAYANWQQRYNDPEAWVPQRIADDILLNSITKILFTDFVFTTDTHWNLEVKGHINVVTGELSQVLYTYTNLVTDQERRIGICTYTMRNNLVKETKKHIGYLRCGGNPFESETDQ